MLQGGTHGMSNSIEKSTNLDLIFIACSDVGDGPTSLLLDTFLVIMGEKCQQTWQSLIVASVPSSP
jgi:hypothetical protein